MNLNFIDNIIFPSWIEKYETEEIEQLKKQAQIHGKKLRTYPEPKLILRRSIELSKSTIYKNLDSIQKMLFISNSVFPEDEQLLDIMNFYGWTEEKTQQLNSLLSKIKISKLKQVKISFDTSLLEEIKHISSIGFGINNPAILINRLNELMITKKNKIKNIKTKKY